MSAGNSLGQAVLELRTDDSALESGIQRARQSSDGLVKSFSQGMHNMGTSMVSTGKQLSMGLTVPIVAAATAIVTTGMSFEAEMSKITGLVGIASDQVDDWGRDILTLAPQLGKAPQELAEALFFVTSAGFRGAEAMDVLTIAGKASAAGLGQTASVADAITSAVNAYGIENMSAARAADIMTAAVREGKLEADQLAPVMGKILPTAAALGVSFEDVAGTLAVMSRTGVSAAEGATSLNAVMGSLLKPTKQANDTLGDYGLTAGELRDMMAEPGGVLNVMRLLDETFGDNDEALSQVIPNVRAFRGVMNVLAQDADTVDSVMDGVANSTGALDAAFEAAQQTMRFKFGQAMAQVKAALIELSVIVMPFVSAGLGLLASGLERGMTAFRRLSPSVQRFAVIVAGVAAALGPLLIVGGKLLILFSALLSPVGLAILALTALGTAFATNLGGIRDVAMPVIEALVDGFHRLKDAFTDGGLMGVLRELPGVLGDIAGAGKEVAANLLSALSDVDWRGIADTILDGILSGLQAATTFAADVASWFWDVVSGIDWGRIASTIGDGIMTALGAVGGVASNVLSWIADGIDAIEWREVAATVGGGILTALAAVGGVAASVLSWIAGGISNIQWREVASDIGNGILGALTTGVDAGAKLLSWIHDGVTGISWRDTATSIGEGIWDAITSGVDAGVRLGTWIYDGVTGIDWKDTATSIGSGIWGAVTSGYDAGSRAASWIYDGVSGVDWTGTATSIGDGIWGVLTSAYDTATNVYNWINDGVSGIDWSGTAGSIASGIGTALSTVYGWGETFGTWVKGQVDGQDFGEIAQSLADRVGDGLTTVTGWGERFTGWFLDALDEGGWTEVGFKIGDKITEGAEAAGLGEQLSSLINDVRQTMEALGTTVSTSLTPVMEDHGDTINNKILPAWNNIKSDFNEAAGIIATSIKPAFDDLTQALDDAGFAGQQLLDLFNHFKPVLVPVAEAIGIFIGGTLLVLAETFASILPGAAKVFTGSLELILGVFSVVAAGIGTYIGVMVKLLEGDLSGAFDVAKEGADRMWEGIKTAFSGGATVVVGNTEIFWNTTFGIFDRFVKLIVGQSMTELVTGMRERIAEARDNTIANVKLMAVGVVAEVSALPGKVLAAIGDLSTLLVEAGKDVLRGFLAGLQDNALISSISGAASSIADLVPTSVTDWLQIRSPSRLMMRIGEDTGRGFEIGIRRSAPGVGAAATSVMGSYARGLEAGYPAVADAAEGATSLVVESVTSSLVSGRHFQAETFLTELNAFSEFLLAEVVESATHFEGQLLDAAKNYMDAAHSAVSLMSNAFDLMSTLGTSNASLGRAMQAVTELKELTEHIVVSIGDSAGWVNASRPEGFLSQAEEYASSAQAGVDLMARGIDVFTELSNLEGDLDSAKDAASRLKFLTEHIVLSIGDSAAYVDSTRGDGFTAVAERYMTAAERALDLMTKGVGVLGELSSLEGDLDTAKVNASQVKFLTEHVVLSIGDSAAFISAERGDGFIAFAEQYATSAIAAMTLMEEGVNAFNLLQSLEGELGTAKESASQVKFLVEHIVQSISDSAALFEEHALARIQGFADAADASFDIMTGVGSTLDSMLAFGDLDASSIDLRQRASEMADLTATVTAAIQEAAGLFESDGLSATVQFSDAANAAMETIGKAGDALEAILTFATVQTGDRDLTRLAASMVELIEIVVQQIGLVAVHFETKGLESVERFSQSASKALETMGSAGDALSAVLMYGAMSPSERDQLKHLAWEMTGVMDYLVDMIRQMSTQYSTDAIDHLSKFAAAVKQSLDLITGAAKAFEAMVDHSRVTSQHADSFVASWEVMVWALQEIARIVSNEGVQDAVRILNANQEIFTYMQQAFDLWQQSQQLSGQMGGATGVKPVDISPVTSPTTGAMPITDSAFTGGTPDPYHPSVWKRVFGQTKAEIFGAEHGGVFDNEQAIRISEGNKREGIIPLENGGASIIASELVNRMRAAPEWAQFTGTLATPTNLLDPFRSRQSGGDDIDVIFNAPVTINAQNREEAERSMADVGWGIRAEQRRRGRA